MEALILQLIVLFTPLINDVIRKYQASHNGALPTDEQVREELMGNIDKYLGEGSAWKAAHPKAGPA